MAKIFIKGRREPIEVPYQTAKHVKKNWLGLEGMDKRAKDDALDLGDAYAGTYGEIKGIELQVEMVVSTEKHPLEDEFFQSEFADFKKEADTYLVDGKWHMVSEMRMLKDKGIANVRMGKNAYHKHETSEQKTHCTSSCFEVGIISDKVAEYAKFQRMLHAYREHRGKIHFAKAKEAEEWDRLGSDVKALGKGKRVQD